MYSCTYHLQQSYKIQPVNPKEGKILLSDYFGYIIDRIIISMFIILTYDLGIRENLMDAVVAVANKMQYSILL